MKKRLLIPAMMGWYRQLIRNTRYRWVVLLGTLIYLISPLDIAPDWIPIFGWIDDGVLATLAITEVTQLLVDRRRDFSQSR
ncbi:MAG: YkvA family protein [Nodosilinea sp.]